jgi:hypothetical protein
LLHYANLVAADTDRPPEHGQADSFRGAHRAEAVQPGSIDSRIQAAREENR